MVDMNEFLASVLPPPTAADTAIHNGDPAPRIALWFRNDPVTLFGALQIRSGWPDIAQHTTAFVDGAAPAAYALRVTTIFRREGGAWNVVHRHADPVPDDDSASTQLSRLTVERRDR